MMPLVALLVCGAFYRWTARGGSTDDTQFGEFALEIGAWVAAAWLIIAGIRHLKAGLRNEDDHAR
jgi:putative Mn2+ efflux pump MntP